MSVWYCIPSKRPPAEAAKCLDAWLRMGYKVAIQRDLCEYPGVLEPSVESFAQWIDRMLVWRRPYRGYAEAVNFLTRDRLLYDPDCDWVVTGGDDVFPDENKTADEIAKECSSYFYTQIELTYPPNRPAWAYEHNGVWPVTKSSYALWSTMGVMQPTGDRWLDDAISRAKWPDAPAAIDRICGSPWMGRSFCELINQGNGPLWPEYHHNWVDEELQNVAIKYGCFWQRRDLIHFHAHCLRKPGGVWAPHLKGATADYNRMKPLFEARKKMGFPGSEPL